MSKRTPIYISLSFLLIIFLIWFIFHPAFNPLHNKYKISAPPVSTLLIFDGRCFIPDVQQSLSAEDSLFFIETEHELKQIINLFKDYPITVFYYGVQNPLTNIQFQHSPYDLLIPHKCPNIARWEHEFL